MSFIHLDKSVVTFHFKEILEDGHLGGPLALVGLGALLLGPKVLSNLSSTPRDRSGMSLSEWVARAQQQDSPAPRSEARPAFSMTSSARERERLAA